MDEEHSEEQESKECDIVPDVVGRMRFVEFFEQFIFAGRWILAPLYAGLVIGMVVYAFKFVAELYDICRHCISLSEAEMMLKLLSLVDITMVGNLILMIMIGGYHIFVRKIDFADMKSRPGWLNQINSGTLKVKMGMSLVGVSSIHLLRMFIEATPEKDHSYVVPLARQL